MFFRKNKSRRVRNKRKNNYVSKVSSVSSESFKKLALNNVKKSLKNYLIYFITLVFGVIILYTFNSLDNDIAILSNNALLSSSISFVRGIVSIFSILVCIIFAFLIIYANNYLMKQRKKEFGIYSILGMDRRDINKLMFREMMIIGIFSLIIGIVFGVFISKGLSIFALKMLGISSSGFSFSILTTIKTIVFFGIVLLLVNKFNKKTIKKYKLIDLLNANKKNEVSVAKGKKSNLILFFLSIVSIVLAYIIPLKMKISTFVLCICLILILVGIYLFFMSVSDFIMLKIKKHRFIYYKNLNPFTVSQISSQIKTMSMSITMICMLLFSSLIVIPFGISFGTYLIDDLQEATPYDVTLSKLFMNGDNIVEYSTKKSDINSKIPSLKDELIANDFPLISFSKSTSDLRIYNLKNISQYDFITNDKDKTIKLKDNKLHIVSISDYNSTRKQSGLKEINLKDNEFAINCASENYRQFYEKYIKSQPQNYITLNGVKLKLNQTSLYTNSYNTNTVPLDLGTIIVPDAVIKDLNPIMITLNIDYKERSSNLENKFMDSYYKFEEKIDNSEDYSILYKSVIDGEKRALNTSFSFVAIYIGIILLISAGAILALQQLIESTVNKERFKLLSKLGVNKKDMKKAIFIQISILFAVPLILALINALFISKVLFVIMPFIAETGVITNMLLTLGLIIIVYGIYFIASLLESLNIVNNSKEII
ncbi:FtsX-like permease family protein [Clostridioides difficile]|uniref:ABC transporter permease n=12 Tax=Clostridioides difficile TaxID=1496 RepID=A0A9P3WV93_CLODI|nr:ABC transporter permease [Clostridioides difficile]AWH77301.1 ABC transporter permease [Clostridioides difficile]AWH81069.1 ABC transporter permease [Clostridioides difficile]AXU46193.1 ABC transporter permease [Clostridioides difficile]AXU49888.1 ABC transporter permease [Clostridioides difficile]EGT2198739.1 FtsX-like permease family protein [Clostridioides difficile]